MRINNTTNKEKFRQQRRKFLASMVMAGIAYTTPTILTLNEAQAGSYSSKSSHRRRHYSKHSGPSYRYHHHNHRYYSRPSRYRLQFSIYSHPSRIRPRLSLPSKISVKISS